MTARRLELSPIHVMLISPYAAVHSCRAERALPDHFSASFFFGIPTVYPQAQPHRSIQSLPLACQPPTLHLAKRTGAAEERNDAHDTRNRERLEEVPGAVVHEENTLHGDDGSEEDTVGDGSARQCLLEVVGVCAEGEPLMNM